MNHRQRLELLKQLPGASTRLGWTTCSDAYDTLGQAARTGRIARLTSGAERGRHLYEVEVLLLNASSDAQVARYQSGGWFFWADSKAAPRLQITSIDDINA